MIKFSNNIFSSRNIKSIHRRKNMKSNTHVKRKCDMWVSNNKVLIGNGKKTHARNPNFDTEETKLLISLWGDPKVQKTLITTHKKSPVIERLAQSMRDHGYFRTPEEINTRIKNLKCLYNRYKKDLDLGILTEPTWKHYQAMSEILNRPIFGRSAAQERVRQYELKQKELEAQRLNQTNGALSEGEINGGSVDCTVDDDDDEMGGDEDDLDDTDDDYFDDDDDDDDDFDIEATANSNKYIINKKKSKKNIDEEEKNKIDDILKNALTAIPVAEEPHNDNVTKMEISPSDIKTEDPIIIPKEEPIDVDEFESNSNASSTELISEQITKRGLQFKITPVTTSTPTLSVTSSPMTAIPTASGATTIRMSTPSFITVPSSTATSQAGKISVVPTNILLKPQNQPQNIIFQNSSNTILRPQMFQTQTNFISSTTQPQNQISQISQINQLSQLKNMNTQLNQIQVPIHGGGNSNMPMKVLLVNRMPQSSPVNPEPPKVIQPPTVAPAPTKVTRDEVLPQPSTSTRKKLTDTRKAKYATQSRLAFRHLIQSLIHIESQNLEVNKKRLDVEKQRLEFEKSVADKILLALPFLNGAQPKKEGDT